jgi:poly(3-hydroxybutyrate) depolymerase
VIVASRNVASLTLQSNWGLANLADDMNAFVLPVSGKTGTYGVNSWNGNLCCCWAPADGAAPADGDYIADLVQRLITGGWPIDPKRVYGIGESAGEGVLYRSACDHASTWAAIFGFSGTMTPSIEGGEVACTPSEAVNFAHAHGTSDASPEPYTGTGALNSGMPNHCLSAIDTGGTMDKLIAFNSCGGALSVTTSNWAQLDNLVPGAFTDLLEAGSCPASGAVQLWRMNTTTHSVSPTAAWETKIIEFFNAHAKP